MSRNGLCSAFPFPPFPVSPSSGSFFFFSPLLHEQHVSASKTEGWAKLALLIFSSGTAVDFPFPFVCKRRLAAPLMAYFYSIILAMVGLVRPYLFPAFPVKIRSRFSSPLFPLQDLSYAPRSGRPQPTRSFAVGGAFSIPPN